MERIIPDKTYKFIEGKLHNKKQIQFEIEMWEWSIRCPENKQLIQGAGFISDPTANLAIKLASPPPYIQKQKKWLELIEQTEKYCRGRKNKIFEIWYNKEEYQTKTQAYTRGGVSKERFRRNRESAVHYLGFRAIDAGLLRLHNEEDRNAAI